MATHYEWIVGGGSGSVPGPLAPVTFVLSPIHGTGLKRVQLHTSELKGQILDGSNAIVEPLIVTWEIWVNTGVGGDPNKLRFSKSYTVPMWPTAVWDGLAQHWAVWWAAGSNEMYFDQEIQAGKPTDPEGPTIAVWFYVSTPAGTSNYVGHVTYDMAVRALYSYQS